MEDKTIRQRFEQGMIFFSSFAGRPEYSIFQLILGGKDVPVSIIRSYGANAVRVFRGFGPKAAAFKPQNINKILHNFKNEKIAEIRRLDTEGNILDSIIFHAKIEQGMDSFYYGFRMESLIVRATAMADGD